LRREQSTKHYPRSSGESCRASFDGASKDVSRWARIGLSEPPNVVEATKDYRTESDVLGQFLAEQTVFEQTARVPRQHLREKYESWCEELGHKPVSARRIAQRLKERGVKGTTLRVGTKVHHGWAGVRLKSEYEIPCEH
jgi:phage/plasmid-associated DNA primase